MNNITKLLEGFGGSDKKNEVTIERVISDGQTRVIEALEQKTEKAIRLYDNLILNVNNSYKEEIKEFNKEIIKPKFL